MLRYVAVVRYAFWCQSTALVVSAVAQTLAGGANSQPAKSVGGPGNVGAGAAGAK
jgi:hypothetical protein|eukprot:COSAG01_NODE_2318_length_7917_cov_44.417242_3_plen_55_part_00